MRICLILVLILLTALVTLPASAKPESFELGSYKVSYDLNSTSEHNITIAKPRYSETFDGIMYVGYGAQVTSADAHFLITIAIIEYKSPILLEPSIGATNKLLSANSDCRNVVTVRRKIDDHQGYLTNSSDCRNDTHGFLAQFLLDGQEDSGKTECLIASTFPWENGTSSMLNTIHLERLSLQ
jgi:hypothetical protein